LYDTLLHMKTIYRITTLALSLFVLALAAHAQIKNINPYQIEFRGGGNLSEMEVSGAAIDSKMKLGFHFTGVFTYNMYDRFAFQTGLTLSKKGLKQNVNTYNEDELTGKITHLDVETTVDANFLQMPLMLGYEFNLSRSVALNIFGGGYGSLGFSGETKMKGKEETMYGVVVGNSRDIDSVKDTFDGTLKKLDYGITGSLGLVISEMYLINFNYEHGLADLSDNTDVYKSLKNRNYTLSLGIRF